MGAAYCVISIVLFVIAGVKVNIGFSGLSVLADEVLGTFSVLPGAVTASNTEDTIYFAALYFAMTQTSCLSKAVERLVDEDAGTDKFLIFVGNIFMGCFFGLVYQSFPYEILDKIVNITLVVFMIPSLLIMFGGVIYGIYKIGYIPFAIGIAACFAFVSIIGLNPSPVGRIIIMILGIALMVYMVLTNPFIAGLTSVIIPQLIVLGILAFIDSVLPVTYTVILILSFAISYPVISACSKLAESLLDEVMGSFSIVIEVVFIAFSLIITGLWLFMVVF